MDERLSRSYNVTTLGSLILNGTESYSSKMNQFIGGMIPVLAAAAVLSFLDTDVAAPSTITLSVAGIVLVAASRNRVCKYVNT